MFIFRSHISGPSDAQGRSINRFREIFLAIWEMKKNLSEHHNIHYNLIGVSRLADTKNARNTRNVTRIFKELYNIVEYNITAHSA